MGVTLRTRKFIRNPLLGRKQMVVDILHPNRANISKDELRGKLAEMYKANKDQVNVFGLQTEDSPRYGKGQGCVQEEGQIDDWSLLQGANGVREDGRRQNWCCGYWALCLSTHTIFANRLHRFFVHGFRWHEQYGRWHKFS